MADHGYDKTGKGNLFYRMNPILIIKGINEKHEVVISDKAISYEDVNSALVELVDVKKVLIYLKIFQVKEKEQFCGITLLKKTIWWNIRQMVKQAI